MRVEFAVSNWAAWAPGLTTPEGWKAWASAPAKTIPRGKETPPLTEVPAMARRRVEKMGRLAFQVATWCQGEAIGLPLIFASRHGDVGRSLDLLTSLAKGEPLSPTSFALSVHNAIGAQYSIIRQERSAVSAISNGPDTLEAAVIEAVTQLQDAPEVVLVAYEASLPEFYEKYMDDPQSDFAFAWKLTKGAQFSLESGGSGKPHTSLDALHFFLRNETKSLESNSYRWVRL